MYGSNDTLMLGTACSGTDLVLKADHDVCEVSNARCVLSLAVEIALTCESGQQKQHVLMVQHPNAQLLVPDLVGAKETGLAENGANLMIRQPYV